MENKDLYDKTAEIDRMKPASLQNAILLQSIGFDEATAVGWEVDLDDQPILHFAADGRRSFVGAPYEEHIVSWLRRKYLIHIHVVPSYNATGNVVMFQGKIEDMGNNGEPSQYYCHYDYGVVIRQLLHYGLQWAKDKYFESQKLKEK